MKKARRRRSVGVDVDVDDDDDDDDAAYYRRARAADRDLVRRAAVVRRREVDGLDGVPAVVVTVVAREKERTTEPCDTPAVVTDWVVTWCRRTDNRESSRRP